LPFVLVNMAMTADGKIATSNRVVSSFGSERDQAHLYELRATADAVMAGAGTVLAESTTLSPGPEKYRRRRQRLGLAEYNLRVVVSGRGRIDPRAAIFQHRCSPLLLLTTRGVDPRTLRRLGRLFDDVGVFGQTEVEFRAALAWLRERWQVRRLLCEGGGELNGALFAARLVDELHLTLCPLIFGGRRSATIADGRGANSLEAAAPLVLRSSRRVGRELFLVYRAAWRRRADSSARGKSGGGE
jgi:riboflavin-specific deaminase-like protein